MIAPQKNADGFFASSYGELVKVGLIGVQPSSGLSIEESTDQLFSKSPDEFDVETLLQRAPRKIKLSSWTSAREG